jgi:F0F1-type ATP synthase membrane subunit b/b'
MLEDSPDAAPDTRQLLLRLQEMLENARAMPLSASAMVNREEFGELLQEAVDGLPEELREARWLLKERDDVLERARREADRIIEAARVRAERMIERQEIVREARRERDQIIETAERQAAGIRHEAEDYVDRKLAAFEVVLDRTLAQVHKGRERLQVHIEPAEMTEADEDAAAFFDQDDD